MTDSQYSVSKKGNINYTHGTIFKYRSKDGTRGNTPIRGPRNVVLAHRHPDIPGEFLARPGANAASVEDAALELDVAIHYPTRKCPDRVFNSQGSSHHERSAALPQKRSK